MSPEQKKMFDFDYHSISFLGHFEQNPDNGRTMDTFPMNQNVQIINNLPHCALENDQNNLTLATVYQEWPCKMRGISYSSICRLSVQKYGFPILSYYLMVARTPIKGQS